MEVSIKKVAVEEKEILRNLLEKYDYEFSQYDLRDVNKLGLFGYDYLDNYWTEKNRWAYFILVEEKLAGFIMINNIKEGNFDGEIDYSLAEFFVLYKYRRMNVGRTAIKIIFNQFPGHWQLRRHPHNLPSVYFWDKIVAENAQKDYRIYRSHPDAIYDDGTLGDIIVFTI